MGKEIDKEPDFYPFRIKDHGWVLKKGVSTETIGEAFKDMVYELVTKDFTPGSIAESMHNDALTMIDARAAKARNAAKTRWERVKGDASNREEEDVSTTVSDSTAVKITPGILAAISDREGQPKRTEEGGKAPLFSPSSKPSSVRNVQLPRNKQEVVEFAIDNGLDTDDASTWAEINLKERKGKDKDGKPILNWKGALTNYCKAMADKRREPA